MYLKDFENVGRLCLDCKSYIVSTANKEQKNSGFSRLVRKTEKQKSEKSVSEEGTVRSLDKNPLTSKVKVRFEPGSWSDELPTRQRQKLDQLLGLGMLTVEIRFEEREAQPWIFFGVDGDEDCAWVQFSALREEKG